MGFIQARTVLAYFQLFLPEPISQFGKLAADRQIWAPVFKAVYPAGFNRGEIKKNKRVNDVIVNQESVFNKWKFKNRKVI